MTVNACQALRRIHYNSMQAMICHQFIVLSMMPSLKIVTYFLRDFLRLSKRTCDIAEIFVMRMFTLMFQVPVPVSFVPFWCNLFFRIVFGCFWRRRCEFYSQLLLTVVIILSQAIHDDEVLDSPLSNRWHHHRCITRAIRLTWLSHCECRCAVPYHEF